MRDRLMMHAVWERDGHRPRARSRGCCSSCAEPVRNPFQAALFSKIVPNCKKLGLLDAGDGWLREKFTEIGVIEFEDAARHRDRVRAARRGVAAASVA